MSCISASSLPLASGRHSAGAWRTPRLVVCNSLSPNFRDTHSPTLRQCLIPLQPLVRPPVHPFQGSLRCCLGSLSICSVPAIYINIAACRAQPPPASRPARRRELQCRCCSAVQPSSARGTELQYGGCVIHVGTLVVIVPVSVSSTAAAREMERPMMLPQPCTT